LVATQSMMRISPTILVSFRALHQSLVDQYCCLNG
jgi:hypothetical protein